MPETDSAICAVIAEIVSRTRRNAACDLTWNQRVRTSVGGRITSATSPSRQSRMKRPTDRREQRQRVDDERRQPLREDVGERVDVRGEARDDPAGLLLREVAQRQLRQVVEEVFAAGRARRLWPTRGEAADERRLQHPGDRVDREVDAGRPASRRRLSCARMPSSIASCTSRSAATGAAAESTPTTASAATRRRWPTR